MAQHDPVCNHSMAQHGPVCNHSVARHGPVCNHSMASAPQAVQDGGEAGGSQVHEQEPHLRWVVSGVRGGLIYQWNIIWEQRRGRANRTEAATVRGALVLT